MFIGNTKLLKNFICNSYKFKFDHISIFNLKYAEKALWIWNLNYKIYTKNVYKLKNKKLIFFDFNK